MKKKKKPWWKRMSAQVPKIVRTIGSGFIIFDHLQNWLG